MRIWEILHLYLSKVDNGFLVSKSLMLIHYMIFLVCKGRCKVTWIIAALQRLFHIYLDK